MFTLGKKVSASQMFVTVWTFPFKFVPFQPPAQNKSSSSARNQDVGLEQPAEETRDVTAALLVSLWRKQESEFCTKPGSLAKSGTSPQPQQEVRSLQRRV